MSNASFKLDGNAPTVSWADPKSTPDNSAAASQVNSKCYINSFEFLNQRQCFDNFLEAFHVGLAMGT